MLLIVAGRVSGDQALPWSGQRSVIAVIGKKTASQRVVRGTYADHVVIGRGPYLIGFAVVAGRRDRDDALRKGVVERLLQQSRTLLRAEAHIDDLGSVVDGPVDSSHDLRDGGGAIRGENPHRHQRRVRRNQMDQSRNHRAMSIRDRKSVV